MVGLQSTHRLGFLLVLLVLGVQGDIEEEVPTCEEIGGTCVPQEDRDNCNQVELPGCYEGQVCCIPEEFKRQADTCSAVPRPSTCKTRYGGVCRSECPDNRIPVGDCSDNCTCCGCKIKSQCLENNGHCIKTTDRCNGRTRESWCNGNRCTCCIPVECPEPFVLIGDQCYYFSEQYMSWPNAREFCQNMMNTSDPSDLAVFDLSLGDDVNVINHVGSLGIKSWWIGGSYNEQTRQSEEGQEDQSDEAQESQSKKRPGGQSGERPGGQSGEGNGGQSGEGHGGQSGEEHGGQSGEGHGSHSGEGNGTHSGEGHGGQSGEGHGSHSGEDNGSDSEEEQDGQWYWVDGRPVDLTRSYWAGRDPAASRAKIFLRLYLNNYEKVPRWRVGDHLRTRGLPFICQLWL